MCETFKWIKLLAVESPKSGLQIPVKKFFGQTIVSYARAFQSSSKMQIFAIRHQISIYGLNIYFNICHMSWTYVKLK